MILDTSFLIDVMNGEPAAEALKDEIDEHGSGVVSTITVYELVEGAYLADRTDAERERIIRLLTDLRGIAIDSNIATLAGEMSATLIQQGNRIELEDILIAATAVSRDEPIVTRNDDHFDRIDALDIRTY